MQAFDTNVVVRVLVDDGPQSKLARTTWNAAQNSGGVFLSKVVLVECAWVLKSCFKLDRAMVAAALKRLSLLKAVVIEDETEVAAAVDAFAVGSADFADYLVRESARAAVALPLATFDVRFARESDVELVRGA